ncbi:MAG: hypothetical protein KAI41_11440, partial [Hyphomicrobiaceae bacterium]|nr:hypothetical protein [Hyphomicrobiaceae bacterium]
MTHAPTSAFDPKRTLAAPIVRKVGFFPEPPLAGRRSWVTSRNLLELFLHVGKLSFWGWIECLLRASLAVPQGTAPANGLL